MHHVDPWPTRRRHRGTILNTPKKGVRGTEEAKMWKQGLLDFGPGSVDFDFLRDGGGAGILINLDPRQGE